MNLKSGESGEEIGGKKADRNSGNLPNAEEATQENQQRLVRGEMRQCNEKTPREREKERKKVIRK